MLPQQNTTGNTLPSPYAASCAQLSDKGLRVIPLQPNEKRPHATLGDWTRFAANEPTHEQRETWALLPGAGIGLLTGQCSGVIGLDFDENPQGIHARIKALLPPCTVSKKGRRGETLFFRYNGEATKRFSLDDQTVLEILTNDRMTVLPPSIHPDTGLPYYWQTGDTLENTNIEDLPFLPAGFCESVALIVSELGGSASDTGSGQPLGDEIPEYDISEAEFRALASALDLVPYTDYADFVKIGMALRDIGGVGFEMWTEWAKRSHHYNPETTPSYMRDKWHGFRVVDGGLGHGSIFKMAREHGWVDPPIPDYAAQLMAGLLERQKKAAKTGLYTTRVTDLGPLKPPAWLIKKHVIANSLAMLYGPPGLGKSFVAFDMGLCVATGQQWQGNDTRQGLVLYVAGEGDAGFNARSQAWLQHHDVADAELHITNKSVPMLDFQRVNELLGVIDGLPTMPAMIIIDTVNRNFGDGDENSTKDATRFLANLDVLRRKTGACVLVVHHTGKGDSGLARGSSTFQGSMDTEMALTGKAGAITLGCTKQKDGPRFPPITFELEVVPLGLDDEGEEISSCVVVQNIAGAFVIAQHAKKLGRDEELLLAIITASAGAAIVVRDQFMAGARGIKSQKGKTIGKPRSESSMRAGLAKAKKRLIDLDLIESFSSGEGVEYLSKKVDQWSTETNENALQ